MSGRRDRCYRFRRITLCFVAGGAVALTAAAQVPPPVGTVEPRQVESLRSHELVDLQCSNQLTRRQVTLFGNGTIRVKEGAHEDMGMLLGDLDPITLRGYTERFEEIDFEEVERTQNLPTEGDWVETCGLELDFLEGGPRREMFFSRFDSLPLGLKRALELTEELAEFAEPVELEQLPLDYDPRPGDVLRHRNGDQYRVIGKTIDLKGVELQGLDSPLTIYLDAEQLRRDFAEVVSRRSFF